MPTFTALPSGLAALEQGCYSEAVALLEFCQSAEVDDQYLHAQMSLVTAYHYSRKAVVKLEDSEFAKLFVVYGNQVEARFILLQT